MNITPFFHLGGEKAFGGERCQGLEQVETFLNVTHTRGIYCFYYYYYYFSFTYKRRNNKLYNDTQKWKNHWAAKRWVLRTAFYFLFKFKKFKEIHFDMKYNILKKKIINNTFLMHIIFLISLCVWKLRHFYTCIIDKCHASIILYLHSRVCHPFRNFRLISNSLIIVALCHLIITTRHCWNIT